MIAFNSCNDDSRLFFIRMIRFYPLKDQRKSINIDFQIEKTIFLHLQYLSFIAAPNVSYSKISIWLLSDWEHNYRSKAVRIQASKTGQSVCPLHE